MITLTIVFFLIIMGLLFSLCFHLVGGVLKLAFKLMFCLPAALLMGVLGLAFCCTLFLVPVGLLCFKAVACILNPFHIFAF